MSKNVYIDKLEDIVTKYSNTYHSIINMKPVKEPACFYQAHILTLVKHICY